MRYALEKHRFKGVPFVPTPNMGGEIIPEYLVIHWTAGTRAKGAVDAFKLRSWRSSAHLIFDRDGATTQMVPFNKKAWHAGPSHWDGRDSVSNFSIGIELTNPGPLERDVRTGQFRTLCGSDWDGGVIEARHPNGGRFKYWAAFDTEQIEAALEAAELLISEYRLRDVIGHHDIAPYRKIDVAPTFPFELFKGLIIKRGEQDEHHGRLYRVTTSLNIRTGPGMGYSKLDLAPLARGTMVEPFEQHGSWWHVRVKNVDGWVYSKYLEPNLP